MNIDRMSCDEVLEKVPLFVGGDLDPEALESVRVHLVICGACAQRAGEAARARRALVAAFRAREADFVHPDLWPGIRATLLSEGRIRAGEIPVLRSTSAASTASSKRAPRLLRTLVPLAAAAALVALVQLGGWFEGAEPGRAGRVLPFDKQIREAPEVVVTPVNPRLRKVTLDEEELGGAARAFQRPQRQRAGSGLEPGMGDASLAGLNYR